ncbi:MAG: bifunctional riboflavin kinase/FAD synthetase [Bryobacteraceae bacterium]
MKLFRTLAEAERGVALSGEPSGVCIGNFDGVHLGHQALIGRLREECAVLGAKPSVLTFDPHPARVLAPERAPRLLSTVEQRLAWMSAAGVEQALVLPFTPEFAAMTPEEFVEGVLVRAAGARVVVVGANFRFGRKQSGDAARLAELGERHGFITRVVEGVYARGRLVSSTEIRKLVESGNVRMAGRLLGRCFAVEGVVVSGAGIGSRQTVPTLNLSTEAEVLPGAGVYVTRATDIGSGAQWASVTNAGVRPTFDGEQFVIETFVLDGLRGEAPRRLRVEFLFRLRDERRFADAASLKAQILRDVVRARRYHAWIGSGSGARRGGRAILTRYP